MRVVCIIQVRMGSTRLPGKAMLPLAGKSMTQNIVERVQRASTLDEVVLAFPHTGTDADTTFADLSVRCGVGYYRGTGVEENDLVGRYLAAAQCYHADVVVRIPGDNPCVEPSYIDAAVQAYLDGGYIFYSNTSGNTPEPSNRQFAYGDGLGCEVFSMSRLKWLDRISLGDPRYREHPHQWFYDQLESYECHDMGNCGIHIQGRFMPVIRLDVNTREDYEFIRDIYDHFGQNRFTVEEVLGYLDSKKVSVG